MKIDCILKHVRTENIIDTNILTKAVTVYAEKKIGPKACESKNKQEREPQWKKRIKKSVNKVRKHINILERHQRGDIRRKEKYEELERNYNTQKKKKKNDDGTAETAAPCKKSKAEEI